LAVMSRRVLQLCSHLDLCARVATPAEHKVLADISLDIQRLSDSLSLRAAEETHTQARRGNGEEPPGEALTRTRQQVSLSVVRLGSIGDP